MKNIILFSALNLSILVGQFSYPAEDFLGGGIGYSPMYIKLDSIPGASYLTNLGLNPEEFDDPFVIHGGEGFAHVTGRWRIGGYAGMGGTTISTIPEIFVFIDADTSGTLDEGEVFKPYTEDFNPSIKAKFSFLLAIPAISGAGLMIALDMKGGSNSIPLPQLMTAFISSFAVGYISLKWLLGLLESGKFHRFGYYCITVGLITLFVG